MLYGHPFNNGQFPLSRQQLVIGADGTSYCNDWKRYQTFYVKDTSDQCAVYIAPATALKRWPTPVERLNKRRVGGWVGGVWLISQVKATLPPSPVSKSILYVLEAFHARFSVSVTLVSSAAGRRRSYPHARKSSGTQGTLSSKTLK